MQAGSLSSARVLLNRRAFGVRRGGTAPLGPYLAPAAQGVRMSWGEAGWNWGSARGEAHDLAIPLRRRLGDQKQRSAFLSDSDEPWESIKLCLGLTLQRAARSGIAPAYQAVYDDLVAGTYEGVGGHEQLAGDLAVALGIDAGGRSDREVVAEALGKGLAFVEKGC